MEEPTPDNSTILSLQGCTLFAEDKVLFQDLNFEVKQGDRVGILGPNGSGKTSLLRAILGQIAFKAGQVQLQGHLLNSISIAERGRFIGYLPQAAECIPPLSIFEFLSSCADQKGEYGASISAIEISMVLTKLGLCGTEHKSLTVLSGGELRRVLFGAAVLGDPKLLLLDEPLVSLDKAARSRMIDVISSKLQEDPPATAIIVSHDEAFLLEFCTRVFQVAHCGLRDLLASNEESEEEIEEDPPKDWIQ